MATVVLALAAMVATIMYKMVKDWRIYVQRQFKDARWQNGPQ